MTQELQKTPAKDEKAIEFIPYGGADKIKLSVAIIKNIVAVPTRTGKTCSDRDAIKFLMLCQAKRLNPFEGDCYLIGYDSNDGVATFSLITAHQTYLKRAELHPEFDGMESGVIVENEDETEQELEGDYHRDNQTLVGGWAKIHFKNRKIPMKRRLKVSRFRKNFGVWKDDPAGMIVKCAEADALRSSFPTMLGGLYMADEISLPVGKELVHDISTVALPAQIAAPAEQSQNQPTEPEPQNTGPSIPGKELGEFIKAEGFTFDQFLKWAVDTGNIENPDNITCYEDLTDTLAKRFLRAKTGLVKGLQTLRETQSK